MEPSIPEAPLTLEGASVLHRMYRVRWVAWKELDKVRRQAVAGEAAAALCAATGRSGIYSVLGHKADLMLLDYRDSFADLDEVQRSQAQLDLFDYLEPTTSFVSVVELGLYDSSYRLYTALAERGIEPHTPEWNKEIEENLAHQRKAMAPRLWPEIPDRRYLCFYPMDRKRGEVNNWYRLPIAERRRQMHDHGQIGRRYAGEVQQVISGSIGFDDWEWGVDLFADDPLVFKKLVYEMRFDEASALYALFGPFYLGLRVQPEKLPDLLRASGDRRS